MGRKWASAWLRGGVIYLSASRGSESGSSQVSAPYSSISASEPVESIGLALREALDNSRIGFDRETHWLDRVKPLVKLAKAKSWKNFTEDSKYIRIKQMESGVIRLIPAKYAGKGAFTFIPESEMITEDVEPTALGETLLKAFEACQ